jgi:hypothetical protein
MINQVVYTVVMKHIWCVLLPVRWCVLAEQWNSTIVQLAKVMWKSTTHLAVLLVLDDQFCNSSCWTVYWEMSPVDEVTWVLIWWWKFIEIKFEGRWVILNCVTAGCSHTHTHTNFWLLYSRTRLIWHLWDQTGSKLSCSSYTELTSLKVIFCYCSFTGLHK